MTAANRQLESPAADPRAQRPAAPASRPRVAAPWPKRSGGPKIKRRDLVFILRNLATLVDHGLPLPKALGTLARERSLRKYTETLRSLQRGVERGDTFSSALAAYPNTFNEVMVNQIRAGEKSGSLSAVLERIAEHADNASQVRSRVIRQLSYPAVLVGTGSLAVTFMLVFVIPVFEETYAEAHVPLPALTRVLMAAGRYAVSYGWILPVAGLVSLVLVRRARRQLHVAVQMDQALLHAPLIGDWWRNMAVLQFIEVFENLMQSGFRLVDALELSADSIGNRAVRQSVQNLQAAVTRGERFGGELVQMGDLFPPVVSQLISVGEKTGNLTKATARIREHLEQEVTRQTNIMVGVIEPVLTIGLAATIAVILLAVYLPMFDMIGAVGSG